MATHRTAQVTSEHKVGLAHRKAVRRLLEAYHPDLTYTEDRSILSSVFRIEGSTPDVARIQEILRRIGA